MVKRGKKKSVCDNLKIEEKKLYPKCWDIWYVDLPKLGVHGLIEGIRPMLLCGTNAMNENSKIISAYPISSKNGNIRRKNGKRFPAHVELIGCGLEKESVVMLEQPRSISKKWLIDKVGRVESAELQRKIHDCQKKQNGFLME